jgi:hypothetical protein
MGMVSGLLTFPLAPVRMVGWVAGVLAQEAWDQEFSPAATRRALQAAQRDLEEGRLTEEQYEQIEDQLVERLVAAQRQQSGGPG